MAARCRTKAVPSAGCRRPPAPPPPREVRRKALRRSFAAGRARRRTPTTRGRQPPRARREPVVALGVPGEAPQQAPWSPAASLCADCGLPSTSAVGRHRLAAACQRAVPATLASRPAAGPYRSSRSRVECYPLATGARGVGRGHRGRVADAAVDPRHRGLLRTESADASLLSAPGGFWRAGRGLSSTSAAGCCGLAAGGPLSAPSPPSTCLPGGPMKPARQRAAPLARDKPLGYCPSPAAPRRKRDH